MPVIANWRPDSWPTLWASMPLTMAVRLPQRCTKREVAMRGSPPVKDSLPMISVRVSWSMSTYCEPWWGSNTAVVSQPPPA